MSVNDAEIQSQKPGDASAKIWRCFAG